MLARGGSLEPEPQLVEQPDHGVACHEQVDVFRHASLAAGCSPGQCAKSPEGHRTSRVRKPWSGAHGKQVKNLKGAMRSGCTPSPTLHDAPEATLPRVRGSAAACGDR